MKRFSLLMFCAIFSTFSLFAMEEEAFSVFLDNLESSIDSYRIDMLKGMSSETYTCAQAERILSIISLGINRVKALEIISTKLEDPENKGKIMTAFKDDIASYKSDAYKIINKIKVVAKKTTPVPAKKEEPKEPELSGRVYLEKKITNCSQLGSNTFFIEDDVTFHFQANKAVGTTKLYVWISECKNSNDSSCYTPFLKLEKDILPDWNGLQYENPISLRDFLTNYRSERLPTRHNFFHIAVIIKDKIIAEDTFEVKQTCD